MGPDVHGREVTTAAAPVPPRPGLRERADPVLAAIVFALFARTFLFQAFEVPSSSMEKNVLTGDRLLVNKFVSRPRARPARRAAARRARVRRGDVVVFRFPEDPRRDFIKRVVGLPGETVAIREQARLRRRTAARRALRLPRRRPRLAGRSLAFPRTRRRRDQLAAADGAPTARTSSWATTATTRTTAATGAPSPRVTSRAARSSSTGRSCRAAPTRPRAPAAIAAPSARSPAPHAVGPALPSGALDRLRPARIGLESRKRLGRKNA